MLGKIKQQPYFTVIMWEKDTNKGNDINML